MFAQQTYLAPIHFIQRVSEVIRLVAAVGMLMFAQTSSANPVLDWTELMIDAIRMDNSGPTLSSRNLAILHTSIFDAVNAISQTRQSYYYHIKGPAESPLEAAATSAAHEVITSLYPSVTARADQMWHAFEQSHSLDIGFDSGVSLGREVARAILDSRQSDGASTEVPYIPNLAPGMWRRTPPFYRPPLAPHWRYVDFFGLVAMEPFVSKPPPAMNSAEYLAAYNEVKAMGGKASTIRTAEQTQIAVFWSDFSYTSMPPGHWHLIALSIARARNDNLLEDARLFAWLSMAQADAAIVCWETKFRYHLWRPITAIQLGDTDNNEDTIEDAGWEPLLVSPPFPSYTSGHSTFSQASASILAHHYGTDFISFEAESDTLPGVKRSFRSFTECADEIGMSRIYGGIHFGFDNAEGKITGRAIGEFIYSNYLLPKDELPRLSIEPNTSGISIRIQAMPGNVTVLEHGKDLVNWIPVSTNTIPAGGLVVSQPGSSGSGEQFYRLR